jgi:CBS-domain-containing membrane protein
MQGMRVATTVTPIHTVHPDMPLTTALSMLMEAGVSALPVVDQDGVLLDVYARSDITLLTRGSAYLHLAVRPRSVYLPSCSCLFWCIMFDSTSIS